MVDESLAAHGDGVALQTEVPRPAQHPAPAHKKIDCVAGEDAPHHRAEVDTLRVDDVPAEQVCQRLPEISDRPSVHARSICREACTHG